MGFWFERCRWLKAEIDTLAREIGSLDKLLEHPAHIVLINPKTGAEIMPNFEALNDTNYAIPIKATNALGQDVPLPAADTFSVTATNGLTSIGTLADGVSPALLINSAGFALTQGVAITVTDADGLTVASAIIDVVADLTPTALTLDFADAQANVELGGAPVGGQPGTTEPPGTGGPAVASSVGIGSNTGAPVPAPAVPTKEATQAAPAATLAAKPTAMHAEHEAKK